MFRPIFEASTFRMGIRNVTVFHREDGKTRLRIMPLRWTLNHWVLPPVVVFYGPRISAFASPFEYPWFQIYECLYLMRLATCYIRVRFHKFEAPQKRERLQIVPLDLGIRGSLQRIWDIPSRWQRIDVGRTYKLVGGNGPVWVGYTSHGPSISAQYFTSRHCSAFSQVLSTPP